MERRSTKEGGSEGLSCCLSRSPALPASYSVLLVRLFFLPSFPPSFLRSPPPTPIRPTGLRKETEGGTDERSQSSVVFMVFVSSLREIHFRRWKYFFPLALPPSLRLSLSLCVAVRRSADPRLVVRERRRSDLDSKLAIFRHMAARARMSVQTDWSEWIAMARYAKGERGRKEGREGDCAHHMIHMPLPPKT